MNGLKNKSGDLKSHAGEPVYKANEATNTSEYQYGVTKDSPTIKRIIDIKNSQALIQMSNGLTRYIHTSFLVEHTELIDKYRQERRDELDREGVLKCEEQDLMKDMLVTCKKIDQIQREGREKKLKAISMADAVAKLVEMRKAGF